MRFAKGIKNREIKNREIKNRGIKNYLSNLKLFIKSIGSSQEELTLSRDFLTRLHSFLASRREALASFLAFSKALILEKYLNKALNFTGSNFIKRALDRNIVTKIGLILGVILISQISITSEAFASESVTYSIATRVIHAAEQFTKGLYTAIAFAYKPVFRTIATLGLIFLLAKYFITKVAPIKEMMAFTLSLAIASNIAFDPLIFKDIIYKLFFNTVYRLDQFVIQTSAPNLPGINAIGFNSISGLFKVVDNSLMTIAEFSLQVAHANDFSFTNIPSFIINKLEALFIYLLFVYVGVYFLIIFTLAIFGAHMMMILLPITISFYPFKKLRPYLANSINGALHYGLTTVFACISIAMIVYLANDLVVEADGLLKEISENPDKDFKIPANFLTGSIMIGFLSIFMIKVSTEFASRLLNSPSSQLGGAFPMAIAGATTLAKEANVIGKVGGPVLGAAAHYMNQGGSAAGGAIKSMASNYGSKSPDLSAGYLGIRR